MSYFAKVIKLDEFKYVNWATQAWMNSKAQSKKDYWIHRIVSELAYLKEISSYHHNKYDELIENASKELYEQYKEYGTITKEKVLKIEKDLEITRVDAKKYEIGFASHAHIDINWIWGFHETVQLTIDTFQTMLDIMKEDSEFIFSQSQVALYQMIEEYHPQLFEEIKARVKEGRWEVTASTWVEGDKNMASGESQARQVLYAKQYLKEAFGMEPNEVLIDFEPDTFGHVETLPEILNQGQVNYLYHVRGTEDALVYRYLSPSNKEVIVFRDAKVYTMGVTGQYAKQMVAFCEKTKLNKILATYGVSDHGGGPTRKDIEMIRDMMNWPLFPKIYFTTYHTYFHYLLENRALLPVVHHELNVIFSGCYTSQSRIKMANRYGENGLFDAEAVNALATMKKLVPYSPKKYAESWKKILLNQFHDILPGSGITYTREYSLGKFQDVMAFVLTNKKISLEALSKQIDTSQFKNDLDDYYDTTYGAGVGFNSEAFKISKVSRGRGSTRIYHLWNTLPYERCEQVEIIVWNYEADIEKIKLIDSKGNVLPFERTSNPKVIFDGSMRMEHEDNYWGHWYQTFLVQVTIPAFGYETVILMQDELLENKFDNYLVNPDNILKVEAEKHYVLENDLVKIEFNPFDLRIISYFDKETNEELVSKNGAGFNFVVEDGSNKMDSWIVGRTKSVQTITDLSSIKITKGNITQRLSYKARIHTSELFVTITLPNHSKLMTYHVQVEWKEFGTYQYEVKTLNYNFPLNKKVEHYLYDVAFGVTKRQPRDIDVCGLSFGYAVCNTGGFILTTDSKYGYRGFNNELQVSLIRSTTDPDNYPELNTHQFRFQVGPVTRFSNGELFKLGQCFNHPIDVVMGEVRSGKLPMKQSYLSLSNRNILLSSIKLAENGLRELVIRCYEVDGMDTSFEFNIGYKIKEAYYTDLLEKKLGQVRFHHETLYVSIRGNSVCTIMVKLEE